MPGMHSQRLERRRLLNKPHFRDTRPGIRLGTPTDTAGIMRERKTRKQLRYGSSLLEFLHWTSNGKGEACVYAHDLTHDTWAKKNKKERKARMENTESAQTRCCGVLYRLRLAVSAEIVPWRVQTVSPSFNSHCHPACNVIASSRYAAYRKDGVLIEKAKRLLSSC